MPAASLSAMARRACVKIVRSINDLGELPYHIVRPILWKVESPEQLDNIEKASPQLCGHDKEIWIEFFKRDIAGWETMNHTPRDKYSYYETYQSLLVQSQREIEDDAALLRLTMTGIKNERANHQSRQVHESTVPKLPKMGGMKYVRTPRKPKKVAPPPAVLSFGSGSRTKTLTGKGVIDRARREAKQHSLLIHKTSVLATPTHKLQNYASQVKTAPRGLVYDYQKPAVSAPIDPTIKPAPVFSPPKRKRVESVMPVAPSPMSLEEKERRLKALTNPKSTKSATSADDLPTNGTLSPTTSSSSKNPSPVSKKLATVPHPLAPAPRVPKLGIQKPEAGVVRPIRRARAPVDPFMPAKRRRLS